MRKLSHYFWFSWLMAGLLFLCSNSLKAITPPDLGPDTTVCGGLILDAGPGYASYQWSTAINDTNQTVSLNYFPGQSRNLTVFVLVTDSLGASALDSVHVVIHPLVKVDLGQDTFACDSFLLDAMNSGLTFRWQDGTSTQQYIAKSTQAYFVYVLDTLTLCEARDTVNVTIYPSPPLDLGPDGVYCDVVDFGLQPGILATQCDGSPFPPLITNMNEGTYCMIVTDPASGCWARDTITIEIEDQPVIRFAESRIIVDDTCRIQFTNGSTGENIVYSWDFGDGSNLVTTRDAIHYYLPGSYQVCLTIINACDTLTQCIPVSACAISPGVEKPSLAAHISLSPNPVNDRIFIEFIDFHQEVKITLFALHGKIIHQAEIPRSQQGNPHFIDLSNEASGVYMVLLEVEDGYFVKRVVKW